MKGVAPRELERANGRRPDPEPGDSEPVLRPGEQLAPGYQVVDHLNRGEALDVYEIWSEERDCRCTAKVLRPDCLSSERTRARLLNEGRLLGALSHPHIVRAYETIDDPHPIVVLETLTGETLSHMIDRRTKRLSVAELAFLGLHLCSAISYLHRHGFLHLDLKPSNIVSERGLAKVLDLSVAAPPGMHKRGVGTLPYMAPEQARGGYVGAPADIWGMGVVLYKAACGEGPFDLDANGEEYPQLERRADPIRRRRRLPAPFAATVDASLEPEPGGRPAVEEVAEVLEALTPYRRRGLPPNQRPVTSGPQLG